MNQKSMKKTYFLTYEDNTASYYLTSVANKILKTGKSLLIILTKF